jgi:tripartite-type tricarboxylate transporter receptor subunit TctC
MKMLLAIATMLLCTSVFGQDKPLRVIVPFPPGGYTDSVARVFMSKLAPLLNRKFVIDNRGVGGGSVGLNIAEKVSDSKHTIFIAGLNQAIASRLFSDYEGIDPLKYIKPVDVIAITHNILVVNPTQPFGSFNDLLEFSSNTSNRTTFSTAGPRGSSYLLGIMLGRQYKVTLNEISYRGSAAALQTIVSGADGITFSIVGASSALPHINANKLKSLLIFSEKRSTLFPGIPTIVEYTNDKNLAKPSFQMVFVTNAWTKKETQHLRDMVKIVKQDIDFKNRIGMLGMENFDVSDVNALITNEQIFWKTLIK